MDIYKYYETLCISKNSTIDEVKYAYKKMCLKYHPDKCVSGNEEFHKDKFIEITNAYKKILEYNTTYESINFYICLMIHIINSLKNTSDVIINLTIDICDIHISKIKKINYNRYSKKGFKEEKVLFLDLYGIQEQYILEKEGDFNIMTGEYSNLVINIQIFIENQDIHINTIINPYEIYLRKSICIYEFYYGIIDNIPFLNDIELKTKGYIPYKSGMTQIIDNMGLPDENNNGANLYIIYEINTNICKINEDTRMVIKEIFS